MKTGRFVKILGMAIVFFIAMVGLVMGCDPPNSEANKQKQQQTQSINIDNSGSTISREFATPGQAEYGKLIGYAPKRHTYREWSVREICLYNDRFRIVDVVSALIKEGIIERATVDSEVIITVLFRKPVQGLTQIGYVGAIAEKGSSLDVLFMAIYKAYLMGGTIIHVVGEGVERTIKASGWGIGAFGTRATIGNEETSSGVAGGGTGYSRATAKEEVRPWIRAIVLK